MEMQLVIERDGGLVHLTPNPYPKGKGSKAKNDQSCPICGREMSVQRVPVAGVWQVVLVCEHHGVQKPGGRR